jgi:hypothetical protein
MLIGERGDVAIAADGGLMKETKEYVARDGRTLMEQSGVRVVAGPLVQLAF